MPLPDDVIDRLVEIFYRAQSADLYTPIRALVAELEKTHRIIERKPEDERCKAQQERLLEANLHRLNNIIKKARD